MYGAFTPTPWSVYDTLVIGREAYRCVGGVEINDLMGEIWLFQWIACRWRLYAMVEIFSNIEISSNSDSQKFPSWETRSLRASEANNNNIIDARSASMENSTNGGH